MKVAVFGATGLVGGVMLKVLEESGFPVTELIPVASERSAGKKVFFRGKEHPVVTPAVGLSMKPKLAVFSAGGSVSLEWAPRFAEAGCRVVDNSSAWRMDPAIKLIIPEINADTLTGEDMIIANPNCSTIQMLVALAPIHRRYKIERIVVSTYQAVTGTGIKAVHQMESERAGIQSDMGLKYEMAYHYPIDKNCIPHCDAFTENDYTKEEMKLVNETHKILDPSISVSPTAVRVPVVGGHSESIYIELEKDFETADVKTLLASSKGIAVKDDPSKAEYPMPRFAQHQDAVFVGRIRKDISNPKAMNLWVVADNLRKGAATNAVQIAQYLLDKGFLK